MNMSYKPGNVITALFAGAAETKRRPVIVLSSEAYHTSRPDVIAGIVTTQTHNLTSMDYVLQDWQEAGLHTASVFRSFIVTLPPSAKLARIGHLTERDWAGVRNCLKLALTTLDDITEQS
jgi:mRNA interferase MazF